MGPGLVQEGQGRWSRYRLPDTDGSEHKAGRSEHNEELLAIAAVARSRKRLPPSETEKILLKLCENRWLTRNQLAELLGRHPDGLRQRFLNPMVEHELLRLRFPDKPNRADQAYTTNTVGNDNTNSSPGESHE